ncbi:MAG: isoprenylcysteine carboxylmethyltransferase family protein [Bacteroidales bacterium]|nr:isoprenylcysteine carboxylmethyltransferase family protein [Bacteroidales bacterium]
MKFRILAWIIMIFGGGALGLFLDSQLFKNAHPGIILHSLSFVVGLFLMGLVMKISKNTGRTLARYGRKGDLKRMETNTLVDQGVYKYMRHPMHLGLLFFPLSFAFLIGSLSFILIIAPVEIIFILLMIRWIEEPDAIRKFGQGYIDYKKQRPWFCIKPECLKALLKQMP